MNQASSRPTVKYKFTASELRRRVPVVIADFMRPPAGQAFAKGSMQNGITRALFRWLEPALSRVFEQPPTFRVWDDEAEDTLPVRQIYNNHNIDPSTIGWIQMLHATPDEDDVELLRDDLADSLIIGFELSPFQHELFQSLKLPYVSLAVHPLRFLHDYQFMLSSNFANLDALQSVALLADDIAFAAQLKRVEMQQKFSLDLAPDCAVLFGQVAVDAALIGPQGIETLQNHIEEVRSLCNDFETVYFKPHPYGDNGYDQVRFLQQFKNVELVAHNPYALLASDKVHTVAALTSSILSESIYFGKKPRALSALWKNQTKELCFGLEALSARFWDAMLDSADSDSVTLPTPPRGLSSATLKGLLNISWETHGSADFPVSGVEVPLDKKMSFGRDQIADSLCRGEGWKPPSGDHRWAGPQDAFLSFRLVPGVDRDITVNLSVSAMATNDHPILLQLVCQGHILAQKRLNHLGVETLRFNIPNRFRSSLGDVEIELRSSHAYSPQALRGISDKRALSVAVREIMVEILPKALLLPVGRASYARDFPHQAKYLLYGWHSPESNGIWTNGRRSRLNMTTAPKPDTDLVLTLGNTRAFLSEVVKANTLLVSVNGVERASYHFQSGHIGDLQVGGIDLSVPIPRAALDNNDGVFTIDLEVFACHSPARAGYSVDSRELAIMVESFKLESAVQAVANQPSEHIANVFGPFNIHTGLAVMARNSFLAIEAALDDVQPRHEKMELLGPRAINFNNSAHVEEDTGFVQNLETGSDCNIFVGDVTRVNRIVNSVGYDILRSRYNICYGAWELETMPTYLADTRYINEYWGLSTFIADAARQRMDVPVHAFPIPVELHYPATLSPRERFQIPEDPFTFLFAFSVDSTMARKNPEAVLEAFQIAFPDPAEPVALVIKSMIRQASASNREAFAAFKAKAAKDPRVILIEETLNRDENASLYMRCDAYISLHRAEGFGLTMAEAMGYGKPTIGTGYSGNLDFMNEDNACLVNFDKIEMDPTTYHNQQSYWAEPDTYNAAEHMRRVYSDILFREKIARAGKRMIHDEFSPIAVGRKILKRLQAIREERS
jgi:glycosyltransferase involved in cell wall biosynthesis